VLQLVLEQAAGYFAIVRGGAAYADEARRLSAELPPGRTRDDKRLFAIEADGRSVGCVELVVGYPRPDVVMLGLLLVAEADQRRGVGARALALVEEIARVAGCPRIRLGVVRENAAALAFWRRQGFAPTGERRPHVEGRVASEVLVFAKELGPGA
jgi:ribosomal protein S18 acetylase RimI-like enzyme